jgi:hypothetical protein
LNRTTFQDQQGKGSGRFEWISTRRGGSRIGACCLTGSAFFDFGAQFAALEEFHGQMIIVDFIYQVNDFVYTPGPLAAQA